MYALHQGKYTSLCMFLCSHDMFVKLKSKLKMSEAADMFRNMCRIYKKMNEKDEKCHFLILWDAYRLSEMMPEFNMLGFLTFFGAENLSPNDWKRDYKNNHLVLSLAERLIAKAYRQIKESKDLDLALQFVPFLEAMVQRFPNNKNTLLYKARIYTIMGEHQKAKEIYDRVFGKKR